MSEEPTTPETPAVTPAAMEPKRRQRRLLSKDERMWRSLRKTVQHAGGLFGVAYR